MLATDSQSSDCIREVCINWKMITGTLVVTIMTCDQFVSFPRLDCDMGNSDRLSVCHCLEMRVLLGGLCVINDEVRAVRRYDCFEDRVSQTVCRIG